METRIVRATAGDASLLENVEADVFDGPIDPARLSDYLAQPGCLMVLALSGDRVIGQVRGFVHHQPDAASQLYIDNLGVAPPRQREGVASRLLDEIMAWGREAGCVGAWVATEAENGPARALYGARGGAADLVAYYEFDLT